MMHTLARVVWVVLLFVQATLTFAQDQQPSKPLDVPLMGSEASPALPPGQIAGIATTKDGDEVYRILVIGDALAGGLGNGMTRVMQDQAGYEILNRFNESSGLARREVYDWSAAIGKIVATNPVDVIVVLVGMNDRQEIRDGNIRHVFKAPEWVSGYTSNVDRLIESAKTTGAKLVWISIPPMANPGFDADMKFLSEIHQQRVAAASGHYIDVRPFFLAPDGSYLDRGIDDLGNNRKLRDSDGIKFMKAGNNRFAQLVFGAIKALDANDTAKAQEIAAKPLEPAPATVPVATGEGVKVVTEPPSFGQVGLDGEALVFRADSLKAPAPTQVSLAKRDADQPQAADNSNRLSAKAGTEAEKMLTEGITGPPPSGRFDDYSAPVVQ